MKIPKLTTLLLACSLTSGCAAAIAGGLQAGTEILTRVQNTKSENEKARLELEILKQFEIENQTCVSPNMKKINQLYQTQEGRSSEILMIQDLRKSFYGTFKNTDMLTHCDFYWIKSKIKADDPMVSALLGEDITKFTTWLNKDDKTYIANR